jgi:hypothetical protein
MTISSPTNKAGPFFANGLVTTFYFDFRVFQASDVQVVSTDIADIDTNLTSGYTVALNANQGTQPGGYVRFQTAPASDVRITILRSLDMTQGTSLPNQGGFYPKVIENALDKLTMLVQQLSEQVGRAYKTSVVSPAIDNLGGYLQQAEAAVGEAETAAAAAEAAVVEAETAAAAAAVHAGQTAAYLIEAAAVVAAATDPVAAVVTAYIDGHMPTGQPTDFSAIYSPGGWDMGTVVPDAPFINEAFTRRASLSVGSGIFNFGTLT